MTMNKCNLKKKEFSSSVWSLPFHLQLSSMNIWLIKHECTAIWFYFLCLCKVEIRLEKNTFQKYTYIHNCIPFISRIVKFNGEINLNIILTEFRCRFFMIISLILFSFESYNILKKLNYFKLNCSLLYLYWASLQNNNGKINMSIILTNIFKVVPYYFQ